MSVHVGACGLGVALLFLSLLFPPLTYNDPRLVPVPRPPKALDHVGGHHSPSPGSVTYGLDDLGQVTSPAWASASSSEGFPVYPLMGDGGEPRDSRCPLDGGRRHARAPNCHLESFCVR